MQQFFLGSQARQCIYVRLKLTAASPISTGGMKLCVTAQQNELVGQPPAWWQTCPLPAGRQFHLSFLALFFLTPGLVPCSTAELEWAGICLKLNVNALLKLNEIKPYGVIMGHWFKTTKKILTPLQALQMVKLLLWFLPFLRVQTRTAVREKSRTGFLLVLEWAG